MNNLEKEFIPYQEAFELKELGFDEPCFGYYLCKNSAFGVELELTTNWIDLLPYDSSSCKAPTFSQAFRWFRENFGLFSSEVYDRGLDNGKLPIIHSYSFRILNLNNFKDFYGDTFKTYEEAELACLKKLIEIVKQEQ
jgi:hypothetical protein